MRRSRHAVSSDPLTLDPPIDHEAPRPVAISTIGLLIPFAIVMIALVVSGAHSLSQIEMGLLLIGIPLGIYVLRRRADRTRRVPGSED
jgi:membrane-associated phospholipid phosphatase